MTDMTYQRVGASGVRLPAVSLGLWHNFGGGDSYRNARAAGFTNIDTYFFPCTGSAYHCKPFAVQLAELGAVFKANNMQIGTIWIDIEVDADAKHGCIGNVSLY